MYWNFADADACRDWGRRLAQVVDMPTVIYLHGDLGAGKTTLAQALLQALGVTPPIKSPTYTLIERYVTRIGTALHLDLYRLREAEELEFIGIRDHLAEPALWLIEWPERGRGFLPPADLSLTLTILPHGDHQVQWRALHARAERWMERLGLPAASLAGGDADD